MYQKRFRGLYPPYKSRMPDDRKLVLNWKSCLAADMNLKVINLKKTAAMIEAKLYVVQFKAIHPKLSKVFITSMKRTLHITQWSKSLQIPSQNQKIPSYYTVNFYRLDIGLI